jgi:hypothetical protein
VSLVKSRAASQEMARAFHERSADLLDLLHFVVREAELVAARGD